MGIEKKREKERKKQIRNFSLGRGARDVKKKKNILQWKRLGVWGQEKEGGKLSPIV